MRQTWFSRLGIFRPSYSPIVGVGGCRRRHPARAPRSNSRHSRCFRMLGILLLSIPLIPKAILVLKQIAPYSNIYSATLLTNTVGAPTFHQWNSYGARIPRTQLRKRSRERCRTLMLYQGAVFEVFFISLTHIHHSNRISDTPCRGKPNFIDTLPASLPNHSGDSNISS